jgi:hypothetical protein
MTYKEKNQAKKEKTETISKGYMLFLRIKYSNGKVGYEPHINHVFKTKTTATLISSSPIGMTPVGMHNDKHFSPFILEVNVRNGKAIIPNNKKIESMYDWKPENKEWKEYWGR